MIGWLPLRQAEVELSTPPPVYAADDLTVPQRPERLPLNHELRAKTAADHALRLYPGPVGELLHDELTAYASMGYLAHQASPVARVVDQLMGQPLPPAALPDNVA